MTKNNASILVICNNLTESKKFDDIMARTTNIDQIDKIIYGPYMESTITEGQYDLIIINDLELTKWFGTKDHHYIYSRIGDFINGEKIKSEICIFGEQDIELPYQHHFVNRKENVAGEKIMDIIYEIQGKKNTREQKRERKNLTRKN